MIDRPRAMFKRIVIDLPSGNFRDPAGLATVRFVVGSGQSSFSQFNVCFRREADYAGNSNSIHSGR
jgi:hypothetical protein